MKQTHFSERKIQMSETLSRRVGRLVSGGFHALKTKSLAILRKSRFQTASNDLYLFDGL